MAHWNRLARPTGHIYALASCLTILGCSSSAPVQRPRLSPSTRGQPFGVALNRVVEQLPTPDRVATRFPSEDAILREAGEWLNRGVRMDPPFDPVTLATLDGLVFCRTLPHDAYFQVFTEFSYDGSQCSGLLVQLFIRGSRNRLSLDLVRIVLASRYQSPEAVSAGGSCAGVE